MITKKIEIEGMTCGHCVMSVKKQLGAMTGVTVQEVSVGSATVSMDGPTVTERELQRAVEEAGYTVASIR